MTSNERKTKENVKNMYENLSMYECVGGKEIVYENILYIIPTSYKVINIIIGETKRES